MNRRTLHFRPTLDIEKLRLGAAEHFRCELHEVFVYLDAVDIWGSDNRDPDSAQKIAFDDAKVRILIRRYDRESGPIEGWLSVDLRSDSEFQDAPLAATLAAMTGLPFYYLDPVPDPDDEPGAEAAQIEVTPEGAVRHVWLSEFSDASGTRTIISGRGEDEDEESEG